MATSTRRDPLALLGQTLTQHPARLLELVIALWIPAMLWFAGRSDGASLETGEGLDTAVLMSFGLAGWWALWWVLSGRRTPLAKGPLWVLPAIAFWGLQAWWLSPTEWRSVPAFGLLWMGWLVFAVISQSLRHRPFLNLMVGLTLAVVLVLGQDMVEVRPGLARTYDFDWMPSPLLRNEAGFGVFGELPPLLWCWLLTLPFALVGMGLARFPGFLRIALGGYLCLGVFQIVASGHVPGLISLGVVALLCPLFLRPRWRGRLRVWGVVLGGVFLIAAVVIVSRGLRERMAAARAEQPAWVETSRWAGALEGWQQAPLTGTGLDSFELVAEGFDHEPSGDDRWGARQTFLQFLAETGVIGFGLGLVGLVGTFGRYLVAWRGEPFHPRDREAEFRHSKGKGERPSQRHRRHRSPRLKRSTTRKVVLGGTVLGLLAIVLFASFETSWEAGVPILLLGIWAGLAERFCQVEAKVEAKPVPSGRKRGGSVLWRCGGVAVSLAAAAVSLSFLDRYLSIADYAEARESLEPYLRNENRAFEEPGGIYAARASARHAAERTPGNAEAWALVAHASMMELAVARLNPEEIAELMLPPARRAVELYPSRGYSHFLLAEGESLAGSDPEVVTGHYARAVELAPNDLRIRLAWALYHFRELGDRSRALDIVEDILARNPEHHGALELKRRLEL